MTDKIKCDYPDCKEEAVYAPDYQYGLHLCPEHFKLVQFIDRLMMGATVEIGVMHTKYTDIEKYAEGRINDLKAKFELDNKKWLDFQSELEKNGIITFDGEQWVLGEGKK